MHLSKIFITVFALSLMAGPAEAIETLVKGAPASLTPLRTPKAPEVISALDPYAVRDVRVDQTGDNPVKARALAIKVVPKLAFQKLVADNMTPEEAASFKYPDDKTIAALVQDFEVKNEQLSSTRYVANYTVRFSPAIKHYVDIKPVQATTTTTTRTTVVDNPVRNIAAPESVTETTTTTVAATQDDDDMPAQPAMPAVSGPARQILVLPYYEDMSGRTLLWEDENTWRGLWQTAAPRKAGNIELVVPVGDINDVASGDTNDVWSGNYRAIEKLAAIYHTADVVLPVANKSGPYLTIDMYFFKNGSLAGRQVLQPYVSEQSEAEALKTGLQAVIEALQKTPSAAKAETVGTISQQLTGGAIQTTTETVMTTAHAQEQPADIDVAMSFGAFSNWTDFQRRLSGMVPPVVMDIKSMSRDSARFRLRSSLGPTPLQAALRQKGILLEAPAVTVDAAQLGASATRPLYSAQLLKK